MSKRNRRAPATKPKVYFAGKIGKKDWRHRLVPGLRDHEWTDGNIDAKDFEYVGPFFVGCDHGCNHGVGSHGAFQPDAEQQCYDNAPKSFAEVVDRCLMGVRSADLVFCYVDDVDCIGSMFELGYASALKKRVVICISNKINEKEFRLVSSFPSLITHKNVHESDLRMLLDVALILMGIDEEEA